jgi:hypothetical protein
MEMNEYSYTQNMNGSSRKCCLKEQKPKRPMANLRFVLSILVFFRTVNSPRILDIEERASNGPKSGQSHATGFYFLSIGLCVIFPSCDTLSTPSTDIKVFPSLL